MRKLTRFIFTLILFLQNLLKKRYTSAIEGAVFTDSENDEIDEEAEEFRLVNFNKDLCSTSDASVPSSSESKKENGVKNGIILRLKFPALLT